MKRSRRETLILALKQNFEAPPPERKCNFLQGRGPGKLSLRHMLLVQLSYLPKWVWVMFGGIFLIALYASRFFKPDMLWLVCALIPFLVLITVTESFRSMACGMEELEMSSRFSLQSILLARMALLGLGNLMLMLGMVYMMGGSLFRNVLFLMVPYLLTDIGCLTAVRRLKGREGLYVCGGIAAAVCCIEILLSMNCSWILEAQYMGWWLAAVGILLSGNIWELSKTMRKTEEYVWN